MTKIEAEAAAMTGLRVKCTTLPVPSAVQRPKCRSNQTAADLYTAGTASRNTNPEDSKKNSWKIVNKWFFFGMVYNEEFKTVNFHRFLK